MRKILISNNRIRILFEHRTAKESWGRFGGGWDWKLGFQASTPNKYGFTIIFNLLICYLTISYNTKYGTYFNRTNSTLAAETSETGKRK